MSRPLASLAAAAALLAALLTAVFGSAARAAPLYEGWTSVRALGMGNAYVAVVKDNDAIFYNPAGIAAVSGFNWTIADPRVGANGLSAYQDFQNYQNNSSIATLFESLYGSSVWVGGGAKTALSLPGIGVAAFGNANADLGVNNPAYPTIDLNYYADYGVATAFGLEMIPGVLRAGIGLKRVNRTGTQISAGASTLAQLSATLLQNQLKDRGTGYGMDLGMQLTIPSPVKPILAISWRDVGYTAFSFDEGAAAPAPIPPNLTLGAAIEFGIPGFHVTPAVDYRYADRSDIQIGEKIGLGVEVQLLLINLRAGLDQGYYTLGVGLDFGLFRFDAATYGVELGAYAGQQQERRYVAQMTMEIDFDPFKFFGGGSGSGSGGPNGTGSGSGSGSGRQRLKQRR
jgi:hypothetical protein